MRCPCEVPLRLLDGFEGHEPWHYLTHVLNELPTTKPDDLKNLLPQNIQAITFSQH